MPTTDIHRHIDASGPVRPILARLEHLPELFAKAREVNNRLLSIERAGKGCAIGDDLFDRLHQPYIREGQRTGAFRFGDPRAMATDRRPLLSRPRRHWLHQPKLRGLVAGLLDVDYSANQMSYVRRLRPHGVIEKIPGTNTYRTTTEGIRAAVFYTKLRGTDPRTPPRRRAPAARARGALPSPDHIDRTINTYINQAAKPGTAA